MVIMMICNEIIKRFGPEPDNYQSSISKHYLLCVTAEKYLLIYTRQYFSTGNGLHSIASMLMLAGTVALANIRQTREKLMVGFDPSNKVIPPESESLFFPWQNSDLQMLASAAHGSVLLRQKSEPKHLELWKHHFFTGLYIFLVLCAVRWNNSWFNSLHKHF